MRKTRQKVYAVERESFGDGEDHVHQNKAWVGLTMMLPVRSRNGLGIRQSDQGRVLYCRTDQQIPR